MSEWDLVGGNPAPGQPSGVQAKANVFKSIANNAVRCRNDLIAIRTGNADFWQGEAADAFRSQIDRTSSLPDDLQKLSDSYFTAAGTLKRYGQRLESLQDQARRSLAAAQTANTDAQRSEARVGAYRSNKEAWEKEADGQRSYQRKLRKLMREPAYSDRSNPANASWAADIDRRYRNSQGTEANAERNATEQRRNEDNESRSLDDARRRLQDAKNQIQNVRNEREQLVRETVQGIQQAADDGIKNKNWFQKARDYVKDNWVDILDTISKVLDKIGLALAIVGAIVAVVATGGAALPIVMTLGVMVAGAKLGVDAILVSQGRRTWGDLAWDAVGLLGAVGGLRAAQSARNVALLKHPKELGAKTSSLLRAGAKKSGSSLGKQLAKNRVVRFAKNAHTRWKQFQNLAPKRLTRQIFNKTPLKNVAGWMDDHIQRGIAFATRHGMPHNAGQIHKGEHFTQRFAERMVRRELKTSDLVTKPIRWGWDAASNRSPEQQVEDRYRSCQVPQARSGGW